MHKLSNAILLLSLLSLSSLQAQIYDSKIHFVRGSLKNDSTKENISFAHIFNESKLMGATSNEQGQFNFWAEPGDTIFFGALGYLGKVVIVNELMLMDTVKIFLSPRVYEIDAVKYNREIIFNITQFPEKELTDFIGFCDFSMDYLLDATGYEIQLEIKEKFKDYLKKK